MNEAWNFCLEGAIHEVFENLCFMLPAARTSSAPPELDPPSQVILVVDFRGAGEGRLQLVLPATLVAKVAAAMLGEDGPFELAEQYDAVSELANIVCGNVLPRVAGERAVFDLASPRIIAPMDSERLDHDASATVRLEEGRVTAALSLRLQDRRGLA